MIFVATTIIFMLLSEEGYEFCKDINTLSIVILIFVISSIWAIRSSSYHNWVQQRNDFYQRVMDPKYAYFFPETSISSKRISYTEKVAKDPASLHLASARSFRKKAILFNMMLFYLFISFTVLFLQFLFNQESIVHFFQSLFNQEIDVRAFSNVLLFSGALILIFLSYLIYRTVESKEDLFDVFVIWTHDNMDKIPVLRTKEDLKRGVEKEMENEEKEMENLWKMSILFNLVKILRDLEYDGNLNYRQMGTVENLENLINALITSEWKDPSTIYLYSIVKTLLSNLRIGNILRLDTKMEERKSINAERIAEKRWKKLEKDLQKSEYDDENYSYLDEQKNQICHKIRDLKNRISNLKPEIGALEELLIQTRGLSNLIKERKTERRFKNRSKSIETCNKLIGIYMKRSMDHWVQRSC